jgi:hypothetical protein
MFKNTQNWIHHKIEMRPGVQTGCTKLLNKYLTDASVTMPSSLHIKRKSLADLYQQGFSLP